MSSSIRGYRVRDSANDEAQIFYRATQYDAHQSAKEKFPDKDVWGDLEIAECDFKADKAGFFAALAGEPQVLKIHRTWKLSSRGALIEREAAS